MNSELKHKLWDFVRPFHAPFTRALRRRLGRQYHEHPEMELPIPEESVQLDVERHLHDYLHVPANDIHQIVIVGAFEADEARRMRGFYPQARFLCFEPNPNTYRRLTKKYEGCSWVTSRNVALSDTPGKDRFYELDMPGNGSLLEPDVDNWAATVKWDDKRMTSFEVELRTLDQEAAALPAIDLLWMDVQGAEGRVLDGGKETLKRVKAIFIEVALVHSPYKGALLFPVIKARLESEGFMCAGLGVGAWNGNGNAFFVRGFDELICK
jgi:2-O-methyltransferase